jgi:hypothetical protein
MTIIIYLNNCARTILPGSFSVAFSLVIAVPPSWSRERKSPLVVSPLSIIPPYPKQDHNPSSLLVIELSRCNCRLRTADCTKVELQVGLVRQKNA